MKFDGLSVAMIVVDLLFVLICVLTWPSPEASKTSQSRIYVACIRDGISHTPLPVTELEQRCRWYSEQPK